MAHITLLYVQSFTLVWPTSLYCTFSPLVWFGPHHFTVRSVLYFGLAHITLLYVQSFTLVWPASLYCTFSPLLRFGPHHFTVRSLTAAAYHCESARMYVNAVTSFVTPETFRVRSRSVCVLRRVHGTFEHHLKLITQLHSPQSPRYWINNLKFPVNLIIRSNSFGSSIFYASLDPLCRFC